MDTVHSASLHAAVLARKVRRRHLEYLLLAAIQGFFTGALTPVVQLPIALLLAAMAFTMAAMLAWNREVRRLVANPYQRLAVDALELALLLGALALSAVGAMLLRLPLLPYHGYLSYALLGYIVGSSVGESLWRWRVYRGLSLEQQLRYVQNLAHSLLLPYSWRQLRQSWRRKERQ
ncbi:MAG: hypothetical protein RRA60_05515 [Chlorobiota bacterium]|jgi:hypothetical protein|nr:hypothetical protein [Chlorobiota bacterium]